MYDYEKLRGRVMCWSAAMKWVAAIVVPATYRSRAAADSRYGGCRRLTSYVNALPGRHCGL